ncbi:hypothetical protein CMI45_02420 [Candidatus Pacearchaeota archaeon]|nr:hypothetical protein [Candidatus Pacearchaeota archaeon]|tara:strand:+ start:1155 stop:1715 length:561 start_codon:yes stop_codon:yes gene_type:complete
MEFEYDQEGIYKPLNQLCDLRVECPEEASLLYSRLKESPLTIRHLVGDEISDLPKPHLAWFSDPNVFMQGFSESGLTGNLDCLMSPINPIEIMVDYAECDLSLYSFNSERCKGSKVPEFIRYFDNDYVVLRSKVGTFSCFSENVGLHVFYPDHNNIPRAIRFFGAENLLDTKAYFINAEGSEEYFK